MLYAAEDVRNMLAVPRPDNVCHSLKDYMNGKGPYILQYVHESNRDFRRRALLDPAWAKRIDIRHNKHDSVSARESDIVETHELLAYKLGALTPLELSIFVDYHAQLFGAKTHLDLPELVRKYSHKLNGPETAGVADMTTEEDWSLPDDGLRILMILTNAERAALKMSDYRPKHAEQMVRAAKRYSHDRGDRRIRAKSSCK